MATIFSLSGASIFVIFALAGGAMLVAALYALRIFHGRSLKHPDAVPVPTFLSAITTLWALSLGFAAADIWSVRAAAESAASAERSAISRLAGTAHEDVLDAASLAAAVRAYKARVVDVEWASHANAFPDAGADRAVQAVRVAIADLVQLDTAPVLLAKIVHDFDELQDARNKRLGIGASSHGAFKWYLVIFLTFLSMIVIAAVNAERPRAARKSLVLFASGALFSLWILALHANPYTGATQIDVETIRFPIDQL